MARGVELGADSTNEAIARGKGLAYDALARRVWRAKCFTG